ncbi:Four helix bundle sensory module for signal transduction [Pricia antarctica]|uniref:Four helix bundle sensory module for signal transduction n=1 Tax=Pricia antarctica TaxID=641691 RepID=A0A1G7DDB0_9FLAO|nr:MCP four helix bundle domain-containing protein [Pricia antarctica]SDE49547.1 Four helix bundle sensory module for signal transduction [Pricia antarctica]
MVKSLSLSHKFQAGLALAIVFLLVLATNRLDHRHFSTVQNTVNSVFEDRVVAQDYIFRLNNLFQEKRLFLGVHDSLADGSRENAHIDELLMKFGKTKLTAKESFYFKQLQKNVEELSALEQSIKNSAEGMTENARGKIESSLQRIMEDLNDLALTQLTEGRQLTEMARKSLATNNLLSNLEIIFLIVIGMIVLVIVFYPTRGLKK